MACGAVEKLAHENRALAGLPVITR
jgi:hypothetical protein